ncbi:putative sugar-binding protein [Rathayibacter sp. PhB151]|uniref:carbohydrate-binding protein n=1 Tax=Rathayibacter sp. PhB151 TaxID=2485189 RepID=UPI0010DA21B9|nr:carbohydrate-binding protein [Rathayibacter sp. PhB151]TDX74946.1 putative sugar-binding protein [Rathayibacter sp. PhB151]
MSTPLSVRGKRLVTLAATFLAAAALVVQGAAIAPAAVAAPVTTTIAHSATTTTRGTVNKTWYSAGWASTSRSHYATTGASFEVVFVGNTVQLTGLTDTGHGIGRVFIDDTEVGTVNYRAAKNSTARVLFTKNGLAEAQHTLRVQVEGGFIDHAAAIVSAEVEDSTILDDLPALTREGSARKQADYTAASWPAFQSALTTAVNLGTGGTRAERDAAIQSLRAATAALVEVQGLRNLITDYQTRVPSDFTSDSWSAFAAALTSAQTVADTTDATHAAVVAAKNSLQDTAAQLVTVSAGSFEPITNNTFWTDTDGNPIYSQGGGIFQFGDTYFWYGVHYQEAEPYRTSPSKTYATQTFASIPVYSSKDLVNWTFENDIADRTTPMNVPESKGHYFAQMKTLADAIWVGRLGVAYNENTGKYTLYVQSGQSFDPNGQQRGMVLMLQGDSPTDDFDYANIQPQIENSPTRSTGDQTVFTDDDGTDYLIFSNSSGRANAFISKLSDNDSLTIEPAVRVGYVVAGREGNAMFKLDGKYYMLTSDLHGWNASANHVIESQTSAIQGAYSSEYTLAGSEKDYSLVSQTGFFVTVHGTKQDTVLYAGDRWADFAWNGNGYNQWVPLSADGGELSFNSLTNWEFNAVTGEWRVGAENNYVLNPDFAADRVTVPQITGWTTNVDTAYSSNTFVSNSSPGADSSRFALQLANANAFSGSVSQQNAVPAGSYRLKGKINTAGGLDYARIVITGATGESYTLDINEATTGWQDVELGDLQLTGATATISIEARSAGGSKSVKVDSLSLVKQATDTTALQAAYDENQDATAEDYSAGSWTPFDTARTDAAAVLASPAATQTAIDEATTALRSAATALTSAVMAIGVTTTKTVYGVGESFDSASTTVTATRADGTTAALTPEQYTVSGFSSASPGERTATITVASALTATGAAPLTASLPITVLTAWSASSTYVAGDKVTYNGAVWLASWWTKAQTPGDPNGPWQEIRQENGVAVWTASRTFVAGDVVTHNGQRYTAKWWTRNQAPGDPNGPWAPTR